MRTSLTLVLLALACLGTIAFLAASATAVPGTPPSHGDWIVSGPTPTDFTGMTGFVEQSLIIEATGTLTITDSELTINRTIRVQPQGILMVINSTIIFNGTMKFDNSLTVFNKGQLTIKDEDGNRFTDTDRSVITSSNDVRYNVTIDGGAIVKVSNSLVDRCGRHLQGSQVPEGFWVKTDNAMIDGVAFTNGYGGLVLDSLDTASVSNCTFDSCEWGLYARGTHDIIIEDCTATRCTTDGILLRGLQNNLIMNRCTASDCTAADLDIISASGTDSFIIDCTFGPFGGYGLSVDASSDFTLRGCVATRCAVGIKLSDSAISLKACTVTDCPSGLVVTASGSSAGAPTLEDTTLVNTTVSVDPVAACNLTYATSGAFENSTGSLACFIVVQDGGVLNATGSSVAFANAHGAPTGLLVRGRGTLNMLGCTLDSPASRSWVMKLLPLSQFEINASTFKHLGSVTGPNEDKGLFVAGGGELNGVAVNDSIYGLVAGRTQAKVNDLRVARCQVAVVDDGAISLGGAEVKGLTVDSCGRLSAVMNGGGLTLRNATITLTGEGFNITGASTVTVRDSTLTAPPPGYVTAFLSGNSKLALVGCSFAPDFAWGVGDSNQVDVYWYLDLTFKLIEPPGQPLANGKASIRDLQHAPVVQDIPTAADGTIHRVELRQRSYTPIGIFNGTPHTVTIGLGGLSDSFMVTMDGSKAVTFLLDNVPPVLTVATPSSGSRFNVSSITVRGTALDAPVSAHSGISHVSYRLDNTSWVDFAMTDALNWSMMLVLTDGYHFIEVTARDNIGNAATANITVFLDTLAPSLVIIHPTVPVSPTNKTAMSIMGMTDRGAHVTIDGTAVPVGPTGTFFYNLTLVEGPNRITLTAFDDMGNRRSTVLDVLLDTITPRVVLEPLPSRTRDATVHVRGTKEANTSLTVDFLRPELLDQTAFDVTVNLVEGPNVIFVSSVDEVGNIWDTTLTVMRHSVPPRLSVVDLPSYTKEPRLSVQGSTDPGAVVKVNGHEVLNDNGTFTTQVTLVDGPNTITVEAADDLGNTATPLVMNVTLDTRPPGLTVTTNHHIQVDVDHADLKGVADPGTTVRVAVTYGAYSKTYTTVAGSTGAFDFNIDLPQIGNHTVTVTVEDLAGNRATDTLNFERVMPTKPPPPTTTSSWQDWLEGNWVYLVLLASIVTSLVIVVIIVVPSKRRRQARTRIAQSRAAAMAEREEGMASEEEESGGEGPGGGEGAGSEAEAEAEAPRPPPGDRPANEWEELEEPEEPEAGDGR